MSAECHGDLKNIINIFLASQYLEASWNAEII